MMTMDPNQQEFNSTVQQFRDEPIGGLHFGPAAEKLLDHTAMSTLHSQMASAASHWERFVATRDLETQIPKRNGIYMFVWASGPKFDFGHMPADHQVKWILYIGKAGVEDGVRDTLRDRYRSYRKWIGGDPALLWSSSSGTASRERRLERFLTLRPLEYWCLVLDDVSRLRVLEKRLIAMFRPPLNVAGTIRARLGNPEPAW